MRNSFHIWIVAAAVALGAACDGDGLPTSPGQPVQLAPPSESTFEPVCSAIGANGSYICITDLDPRPGTPTTPKKVDSIRARLQGRTPPVQPNQYYHPGLVWGEGEETPDLGQQMMNGRVVSDDFDVWMSARVEFTEPGTRIRVCARLGGVSGGFPHMRPLESIYSPWVEGYVQ